MSFFFSSRSGDSKGTKSESTTSVKAVLKSRWYSKSRNMPSPISTGDLPPPQLSASPAPSASTTSLAADMARANTLLSPTSRASTPLSATPDRRRTNGTASTSAPPRSDPMTVTLAARLEELEMSNSEGLLNDEGYRILRQNLFASFTAPNSPNVSSHQSGVRISGLSNSPRDSRSAASRPLADSNFHVSPAKAESIRSGHSRSTVSAVKNVLWRRSSKGRPSISADGGDSPMMDNASMYSGVSRESASINRVIASSKSSGSIRSEYSQSQPAADRQSLSSKRTGLTAGSRATSRSKGGPPSSYNLRRTAADAMSTDSDDDAHKQSSTEIRTEIAQVEAEYKRILDNYHGAEMAALAKLPNPQLRQSNSQRPLSAVSQSTVTEVSWTMVPPVDDSSGDVREFGAGPSNIANGASGTTKLGRLGSLRKKQSSSSTPSSPTSKSFGMSMSSGSTSQQYINGNGTTITKKPSVVKLSASTSVPSFLGKSTPNLHLQPSSIRSRPSNLSNYERPGSILGLEESPMSDGEDQEEREFRRLQKQIDRIRSSREDATKRYDIRLEYLKTKLKSAEIHERLLKK